MTLRPMKKWDLAWQAGPPSPARVETTETRHSRDPIGQRQRLARREKWDHFLAVLGMHPLRHDRIELGLVQVRGLIELLPFPHHAAVYTPNGHMAVQITVGRAPQPVQRRPSATRSW